MKEFEKNITFASACHRGESEIDEYLESIDPNIRVIVVENLNNIPIKHHLEKKFSIIWKLFGKKIGCYVSRN